MELQGVKLVAADMDGTLLDEHHNLPPDFYGLFDKMHAKGIRFAAASGRQYYNLYNKLTPISDKIAFIAENGSYVMYQGKEIFVQSMRRELVHQLILAAREISNVDIILCGKKAAYLENDAAAFMYHVEMYYDERIQVKDLLDVDDEFLKIALCDLNGAEKNSYPQFAHLQDQLQVKVSGKIWLDLSHKMANKGNALKKLQELFNVIPEETMVFGDYLNDLEMMQQAYYSYAMANAHTDVKTVSKFMAKSNNEYGVQLVLEEMLKSM